MRNLIGERELLARRKHRLHARGERTELLCCSDAARNDVRRTLCELCIPREKRIGRGKPLADVLQESSALAQDVRIAQKLAVVGGACLRELGIQIAAAQRGRALDEEEILRGEEHHRQDTDKLPLFQRTARILNAPPCAAPKGKGKLRRNIMPQKG